MSFPARPRLLLATVPVIAGLLAGLLASCTSTYRSLDYGPRPAMAVVQPVGAANPLARVLISIQGVRYDKEKGYTLEVRLRVENRSPDEIQLFVAELLMVEGSLEPFGPPRILDVDGNDVAPGVGSGGERTFDLVFPFPPHEDELDMNTLNLKWGLLHPGGEEVLSTTFERLYAGGYSSSGWYSSLSFGFAF